MLVGIILFVIVIFVMLLAEIVYLHKKIDESYTEMKSILRNMKGDFMGNLLEQKNALIKTLFIKQEHEMPIITVENEKSSKRSEAAKKMWAKRKAAEQNAQQPNTNQQRKT
jgi:hypothetical protein